MLLLIGLLLIILQSDWTCIINGYVISSNQRNARKPFSPPIKVKNYHMHSGSRFEPPSRPSLYWDDPQYRPYFDNGSVKNVTTQLGKTTYLYCNIRQLGDRTVSWVRQRDLHILTVGSYTYTSDIRFSCVHLEDSNSWDLEIKYVRKEDQGVYECQISTEPKLSYSVRLIVKAAKAIIPEGPLIQLATKSQLKLTCLLENNYKSEKNSPSFVFWYKDGAVINYLSERPELRIITNIVDKHHVYNRLSSVQNSKNKNYFINYHNQTSHYSSKYPNHYLDQNNYSTQDDNTYLNERDSLNRNSKLESTNEEVVVSILTIDGVRFNDSGEYACKPSYADFANVTVQILKNEPIRETANVIINNGGEHNIFVNRNFEDDTTVELLNDDEENFYIIKAPPKHILNNCCGLQKKFSYINLITFLIILFHFI